MEALKCWIIVLIIYSIKFRFHIDWTFIAIAKWNIRATARKFVIHRCCLIPTVKVFNVSRRISSTGLSNCHNAINMPSFIDMTIFNFYYLHILVVQTNNFFQFIITIHILMLPRCLHLYESSLFHLVHWILLNVRHTSILCFIIV